jgi:hypothetical protein
MKIILKESQYVKLRSANVILTEDVNLSGYDSTDFMEVFFLYFRNWVREKHGDDVGKYPASILLKKYLEEFGKDMGINLYSYGSTERKVIDAGKELVKIGKHQLSSLRSDRKFIEQHKRALDVFFKGLKIPEFMTVEFTEDEPYDLDFITNVDYQKLIKNHGYENYGVEIDKPGKKLREFIKNVMGIEFGNPVAGQLQFSDYTRHTGDDSALDKELRAVKKEIKKGHERDVRAFKVEKEKSYIVIRVMFNRYTGWSAKDRILNAMRNKIVEMGYNPKTLRVETN